MAKEMNGRLDNNGWLLIERNGYEKAQLCPFGYTGEIMCGDWCPHFGEPITNSIKATVTISICHGKSVVFNEQCFDDGRR